jgi:hypothetical protein
MGRFFCKKEFIKFLLGRSAYFFNRINATSLYMTCFVIVNLLLVLMLKCFNVTEVRPVFKAKLGALTADLQPNIL